MEIKNKVLFEKLVSEYLRIPSWMLNDFDYNNHSQVQQLADATDYAELVKREERLKRQQEQDEQEKLLGWEHRKQPLHIWLEDDNEKI